MSKKKINLSKKRVSPEADSAPKKKNLSSKGPKCIKCGKPAATDSTLCPKCMEVFSEEGVFNKKRFDPKKALKVLMYLAILITVATTYHIWTRWYTFQPDEMPVRVEVPAEKPEKTQKYQISIPGSTQAMYLAKKEKDHFLVGYIDFRQVDKEKYPDESLLNIGLKTALMGFESKRSKSNIRTVRNNTVGELRGKRIFADGYVSHWKYGACWQGFVVDRVLYQLMALYPIDREDSSGKDYFFESFKLGGIPKEE